MMYEKTRLHPLAILLNMLKPIKELLFFFIIILFAGDFIAFLIFTAIFLVADFIYAFLAWYRFTYYISEDGLRLEYGIFKRTKRSIAKNRIQSIDLTESILHRLFRLTRVQVETASGGTKAEASLSAVTMELAQRLRSELKNIEYRDEQTPESQPSAKREITSKRLLLTGVTSGGISIILGVLGVGLVELEEIIPENIYEYTYEWFLTASIIAIVIIAILITLFVWVMSVVWVVVRYGKFTISRTEDEILITRGLLERKQLTIPVQRIQAVGIEENLIRQPFGYAAVYAEIAGGTAEDKLSQSTFLFPLLHKSEISAFLEEFIPEFKRQEEKGEWVKPPVTALPFYLVRSSLFFLLASLVTWIIFPGFAWIPLVLTGLSLIRGWFSYQDAGFIAGGKRLLIRYRLIKRVTVLLYHKRIQAMEKKQNPLQRKYALASMQVSILSTGSGTHYRVKDIKEENIDELYDKVGQSGSVPE